MMKRSAPRPTRKHRAHGDKAWGEWPFVKFVAEREAIFEGVPMSGGSPLGGKMDGEAHNPTPDSPPRPQGGNEEGSWEM